MECHSNGNKERDKCLTGLICFLHKVSWRKGTIYMLSRSKKLSSVKESGSTSSCILFLYNLMKNELEIITHSSQNPCKKKKIIGLLYDLAER